MAENCTHDCKTCGSDCAERKQDLLVPQNPNNKIKKVIAIASGKGGVGKSTVTSLLAVELMKKGYQTAVLDADITGPSIPKCFGVTGEIEGKDGLMLPLVSKGGIKVISANLLLKNDEDPVIWRGPVIAGAVKQFWSEVLWGEVDFLFIDMPPGTGDVPLTVFQSIPVDGIVVVTSPQELVSMVVAKAVNMAKKMNVPVLGLVENFGFIKCPDCGKVIEVFGKSKIDSVAETHGLPLLGRMPIDPTLAALCDNGDIESNEADYLRAAADVVETLLK